MLDIEKIWGYYKKTAEAQSAIHRFETCSFPELIAHYNLTQYRNIDPSIADNIVETIFCYGFSDLESPENKESAKNCLIILADTGIMEEGNWFILPKEYQLLAEYISGISYAASKFSPDYFYPYLFSFRFPDFIRALTLLKLSLPTLPNRKDWKGRYLYYWEICNMFCKVRERFHLSHAETCAFIYDFIPSILNDTETDLPNPTQCWFIGGPISDKDKDSDYTSWQTNKDTKIGDILVHYETSPVSAVTTIWRAFSYGCIDPFYHWNTYAQIGYRIDIPHITLADLRRDEYFANFPLVRKNFQGVNGFPIPAEAYNHLMDIIVSKGGDTSKLPKLYAPVLEDNDSIKTEKDVEDQLIIPFLTSFGLQNGTDYKQQMGIHVGRGHRVIPDFVIHYKDGDGEEEEARILIEAKYRISNRQEYESAFKQARSYALHLKAEYLILCDKFQLLIFKKKDGDFLKDKYTSHTWTEIGNPDVFNQLKKIFE